MLSVIAIVPSAPVLVPELAGTAADELAELSAATLAAAALLPDRWLIVGTGAADQELGDDAVGTFAGFGMDVPVRLSPPADGRAETAPAALPLCVLLGGWLRGQVQPRAAAQQALDDALAGGDIAALRRLPGQILGRVAFGVLAGLAEPGPRSAKELYRGAPYGVGYFAGAWQL